MQSDDVVTTSTRRPLDGTRVLDLTRVVSGAVVGRIMGDLGADVVKVEPPEGDVTRLWGLVQHGTPGFFLQQNASKRGMCVDLRKPEGVATIIALAATADVVLENFRGGVMDRLGLGWPVLHAVNARLVMMSISGFGQAGPESERPAYASVIQAEAGFLHRHAEFDGRAPSDPITSIADYNAGLHGAIGALAALQQAQRTGVGDHLDIAMVDSMLATDDYVHYAIDGVQPPRLGGDYYQTADGRWTVISGPTNHVFREMSRVHSITDPTTKADDVATKIRLRRGALAEWALSIPHRSDLTPLIEQAGLPWGALNSPAEAIETPTVRHRGTIASVIDSGGETRRLIQTPYRFAGSASGARSRSPHLGEHNEEVLKEWLGYSTQQVKSLTDTGVLLASPAP
jgi:CoA:oxalate CoA-transferase